MYPEELYDVTLSDPNELILSSPQGNDIKINIADIVEIQVETNDSGPIGADVWFVFKTTDSELRFPQGANGADTDALFKFLEKFPGIDYQTIITSMSSTDNAIFSCWKQN